VAIIAVAMAGGLVLFAAGAAATPRVKVPLPAAGQTTVVVTQLCYATDSAPRGLKLRLANRAKLGAGERGIYAVYRKRRARTTALTFVSLLLRKEGAAAGSAGAASTPPARSSDESFLGTELGLFFLESHFIDDEAIDREEARREEDAKLLALIRVIGDDAPIELSPRMGQILEYGGVVEPPASNPGKLGPSLIDADHYDDGHSFGWDSAGIKPAIGSWLNLTAGTDVPYERLIEELESRLKADLDGDGSVDKPKARGKIETEVGAPVIN